MGKAKKNDTGANLGFEAKLWLAADKMRNNLKADYVLANPPFNDSDWGGAQLREDVRWKYGTPPTGNANFAWVQHFIHHLAPNGMAGFVLANGSMSSNQSGVRDGRSQTPRIEVPRRPPRRPAAQAVVGENTREQS